MPDIMHQIQVMGPDEIVRFFALGFNGLRVASATVNMSLNITGYALDEFERDVGRRRFNNMFETYCVARPMQYGCCPQYWNLIFAVVQLLTGHDFTIKTAIRSWNNNQRYGAEHNDRYGVYHFIGGNLIMMGSHVLSFDNFIK